MTEKEIEEAIDQITFHVTGKEQYEKCLNLARLFIETISLKVSIIEMINFNIIGTPTIWLKDTGKDFKQELTLRTSSPIIWMQDTSVSNEDGFQFVRRNLTLENGLSMTMHIYSKGTWTIIYDNKK